MSEKKTKRCEVCGERFEDNTSSNNKKYCSKKCRDEAVDERNKIKRRCEVCERYFYLSQKVGKGWIEKTNRGRFCSRHCYYIWRREKRFSIETEFKKGHIPKSPFKEGHKKGLNKDVTEETRKKISASLQGITLDEWEGFANDERQKMIHSKEYIKWRNKVFKRDNYTCQKCSRRSGEGYTLRLEVHHILRVKEYPELKFDIENGITLCVDCHNETKKKKNKIAVIGSDGYIGSSMIRFLNSHYQVIPYDINGRGTKKEVNKCNVGIICVPTPKSEDGSADLSYVNEVISWLKTPLILIKSTIPPTTTEYLKLVYKKRIVFSPEYVGESSYWLPYKFGTDMKECPFVILGGDPKDTKEIIDILTPVLGPAKIYYQVSSTEAEIIKYMENSFFATKITFVNEFKKICDAFGVDFYKVREGWLLDPRINKMHTMTFKEKPGFSGKCLPKDINALVKACEEKGYDSKLLKEVISSNERFKNA